MSGVKGMVRRKLTAWQTGRPARPGVYKTRFGYRYYSRGDWWATRSTAQAATAEWMRTTPLDDAPEEWRGLAVAP